MSVTKQDIEQLYKPLSIYQVGKKQLFNCVILNKACCPIHVLISYKTIVGIYDSHARTWILTKEKYSRTTSKQLTQFAHAPERINSVRWTNNFNLICSEVGLDFLP